MGVLCVAAACGDRICAACIAIPPCGARRYNRSSWHLYSVVCSHSPLGFDVVCAGEVGRIASFVLLAQPRHFAAVVNLEYGIVVRTAVDTAVHAAVVNTGGGETCGTIAAM